MTVAILCGCAVYDVNWITFLMLNEKFGNNSIALINVYMLKVRQCIASLKKTSL